MKLKKIFIIFAVIAAMSAIVPTASAFADSDLTVLLDGEKMVFDAEPQIVNDRTMVPMRAIFEALGAEVLWDEDTRMITAIRGDMVVGLEIDSRTMTNNSEIIELDSPPIISQDRTLVPLRAVTEAFGCTVEWDGDDRVVSIFSPVESGEFADSIALTDDYRYSGYDGEYNGVSIFDNEDNYFGMELLRISESEGDEYADIVNAMADSLPDVRVFCGIVPTPSEFYAKSAYRTNYLSAISHIYNNLGDNVVSLNIEGALSNNIDKYIYFRTDHHWTQLGAYYGYSEFCSAAGLDTPALDEFERMDVENYLGSWSNTVRGTDGFVMLSDSRDTIELYLPNAEYTAEAYSDMELDNYIADIKLIDYQNASSYTMFIDGDNPIVHIRTSSDSGRSITLIKESYGNAFSTWLVNNYTDIYIVDYRILNGNGDNPSSFNIAEFYALHPFDDLLVLSYPYTIKADDLRGMLGQLIYYN